MEQSLIGVILTDVILTNRKHHFKNSIAIETSLSDFHKLILTTLKSSLPKYHPEVKGP